MLPTVDAYLQNLPHGVDSYPGSVVKGAVTRALLDESAVRFPLATGHVPPQIDALVRDGFSVNGWLPETYHGVLACAVYDLRFREAGGMEAFGAWVLEGNRKLLRSPLYRIMFLVASPERIFIGAERRWASFHRGSVFRIVEQERRHAKVRLTYPLHLFAEHAALGFGAALRAALEAAGAKDVWVESRIESGTSTLYIASWG